MFQILWDLVSCRRSKTEAAQRDVHPDDHGAESSAAVQYKIALLAAQREREEKASPRFVENQRVRHFYKATNSWLDRAYVLDCHDDDGPDLYYTIKYYNGETWAEKQTTGDRLQSVEFDEERTWAILVDKKNLD